MENAQLNNTSALQAMTQVQEALLEAESFLNENYQFRHNLLSGKTELKRLPDASAWEVLTEMAVNSIILHAKREGIGGKRSPKNNIEELLHSNQVPLFDPIRDYLDGLPEWNGKNHVAQLFGRLPGVTSEQLAWLSTWLRSAVAHWLGMDTLHGNECVPVLIGEQGCGKRTVGALPRSWLPPTRLSPSATRRVADATSASRFPRVSSSTTRVPSTTHSSSPS